MKSAFLFLLFSGLLAYSGLLSYLQFGDPPPIIASLINLPELTGQSRKDVFEISSAPTTSQSLSGNYENSPAFLAGYSSGWEDGFEEGRTIRQRLDPPPAPRNQLASVRSRETRTETALLTPPTLVEKPETPARSRPTTRSYSRSRGKRACVT